MTNRYPYVHVSVTSEDAELASLALWELGASGVEERSASTLNAADAGAVLTLVGSFATQAEAEAAAAQVGEHWPAEVRFVEGDAWREAYKEYFKPTRVGARVIVRPPWEDCEHAPGDVVLVMDPGAAFGTGTHETTRLVLEELQGFVRPDSEVLDVGCGSGILAIACLLLGAKSARAVDNDSEAVRVANENAVRNGVQTRLVVDTGAPPAAPPLAAVSGRYPLVLANIETRVLVPMASALMSRLQPGGILILSGILAPEREVIRAAYSELREVRVRELGEWIAFVLQRPLSDAGDGRS